MKTLICICSASRSGSTMLDLMIGNTDDAFSTGEAHSWFRPWKKHHFKFDCACGQDPCPVWSKLKDLPESKFHLTAFNELGVNYVIDSSKELCWLIDTQRWVAQSDVKIYNFLIWKNPIDLIYSHWKRKSGLNVWRTSFVRYYGKALETGLPFISVYFNDLVADPQKKLREICEVIGMPYFEGKENFWEKQHHQLFGSGGVRTQTKTKSSKVRSSENYPPEFEAMIGDLTRQIESDQEVQQILAQLYKMEISTLGEQGLDKQSSALSPPYPLWYYLMRMRQRYRRIFPLEQVDLGY